MIETKTELALIEDYHADTSHVTASMLKSLHRSPRIFEAEYVSRTIVREPSPAMAFGTALHTAVLEPDRFSAEYAVCDAASPDRRTKAYKEWAATVDPGKTILSQADFYRILKCTDAINAHPIAGAAVRAAGAVEQPITWMDTATGVRCKCRPDKRTAKAIVDLKTTQVCSEEAFAKTVVDFGYHIQAAHYLRGVDAEAFLFVVVETSEPYRCRTFQLKSDALDCGDYLVGQLLTDYARRTEAGDWSEPNESDLVAIDLPEWYTKRVYRS